MCSNKEQMKKIQSKKGFKLYKCTKCGNIKDIGIRDEDDKHVEYALHGEPGHTDLTEVSKTQKKFKVKNR